MQEDSSRAEAILSGTGSDPAEMLQLAKRLARSKQIGLARRILKLARVDLPRTDAHREIFQKSALYTYKDPDLPAEWRLDRALEILCEPKELAETENQETLGLAGAIYKRKWEVSGQRQNLERALV
jgi:hypothetical protein